MSTIKVEVVRIDEVKPHPNADALELAIIGGWQMCVKKGVYRAGSEVVYFEPGTVLPLEVTDRLNVTQYLSEKTNIHGERVRVIHRVRLRGEPSFGLVIAPEPGMTLGQDVAERYGAVKFLPPVKSFAGDVAPADPRFPAYTEVENLRSYSTVFAEGEEVVATEKIHGTNCRVGFVLDGKDVVWMAGSRTMRRKQPDTAEPMRSNHYWFPLTLAPVKALLEELAAEGYLRTVLYGEVFGPRIQSYDYGQAGLAFRAFDLIVGPDFVNHDEFLARCARHGVPVVPEIYRGPFSLAAIRRVSDGDSLTGGKHGREGVVVKPVVERHDPAIGRVILKYIGDQYLFGKAAEEDTTDA
jgi:RNA ligase (TIGR02306 family)